MKINDRIMTFAQIIEAQDRLNELTKSKWKSTMTPAHYVLQSVLEMAELICDSGVKYKWWKLQEDKPIDDWNVKIEVIDMLHFMTSAQILAIRKKIADGNADMRKQINEPLDKLGSEMFLGSDVFKLSSQDLSPDMMLITPENWINYESAVEVLMNMGFYTQETGYNYLDIYRLSFANMMMLVTSVNLTSLEISAIYTAKMTLNEIRQSSGYKDGSYVKVQDGVEDNQKLKDLVDEFIKDENMSLARLTKNVRNRFFQSKI